MSTILDQIVETKREEVARRKTQVPVKVLKERITELGRPRNFFNAVTQKGKKPVNLIAEVKKASPSAGLIRPDFDPVKIAQAYEAAGADALSVLTDEKYFQGNLEYIHAIRDVVKLPVLRKDFIVDPYQVYETRAAGADAMLLIAECLEMSQLIPPATLARLFPASRTAATPASWLACPIANTSSTPPPLSIPRSPGRSSTTSCPPSAKSWRMSRRPRVSSP
ncbi:MAG TPA: indole-3-glycerol phosphate synthase TrpC [Tepidisphaeraceae bacterium]|nr:indole-3-glycerol phosphate synthase TrpC [Tepidisphaeraceae bacterium]